jgi:hypothetical protein
VASTITLAGGNNITLVTGANVATISGANTHAQQTAISGLQNSETTYTSGTVNLSVVGGPMTIRSTTGQAFQFSIPAALTGISGISNSNTTYTSGTVGLSELGAITIRSTTGNQFQFSVNSQTAQTFIGGLVGSNATYTSGTVSITGVGGGITVSSNTGQRIDLSVAAPVAQTNQSAIKAFGASNTGNTAGNTGVSTGVDWVLAGSTNITVSESTVGGGPNTLWLSVPNVGGGGAFSGGVSTGGNTAGSTGVTGTRFVFVGTDNISLSQSTDANGGTLSIRDMFSTATTVSSVSSANAVGANNSRFALEAHIHEGVRRVGISTQGNTAGTTGILPGSNIQLVATNDLTLSQSTDAASNNTITIQNRIYSGYDPFKALELQTITPGQASWVIQPMYEAPNFQFDRIGFMQHYSQTTNSSGSFTISQWVGIYTRNVSTLSLSISTSTTMAFTGSGTAGSFSQYGGVRLLTIPWTNTLIASNYWIGQAYRTTSGGVDHSFSIWGGSWAASSYSGILGVGSNATMQPRLGFGVYSASSTAVPGSIGFNEITGNSSARQRAPHYMFASGTA